VGVLSIFPADAKRIRKDNNNTLTKVIVGSFEDTKGCAYRVCRGRLLKTPEDDGEELNELKPLLELEDEEEGRVYQVYREERLIDIYIERQIAQEEYTNLPGISEELDSEEELLEVLDEEEQPFLD